MMKGRRKNPKGWSTLETIQGLVLSLDMFGFFSFFFFFFLVWKPCGTFLSNGLHCSHQEYFMLLEIKLPKIHSRLFVHEKSVGTG